jgi:hypothetical protein
MERIKPEPYTTVVHLGDKGQQGYKLIYYQYKPEQKNIKFKFDKCIEI